MSAEQQYSEGYVNPLAGVGGNPSSEAAMTALNFAMAQDQGQLEGLMSMGQALSTLENSGVEASGFVTFAANNEVGQGFSHG